MRRLLPLPVADLADLWDLYALPAADHLRLGFVQSLDGAISVEGSSRPLSGTADLELLRTLRACADVVLVGAETARREDYGPLAVRDDLQARRVSAGMAPLPTLAVITRDAARLDPASRLLSHGAGPVTVVAGSGLAALPEHVQRLPLGGPDLPVAAVVEQLRARCGPRVLCEGGPHLARQLLEAGVVDELCLTLSPQLVGAGPGLLPASLSPPLAASLASLVESDGTLLSRWALVPAAGT